MFLLNWNFFTKFSLIHLVVYLKLIELKLKELKIQLN